MDLLDIINGVRKETDLPLLWTAAQIRAAVSPKGLTSIRLADRVMRMAADVPLDWPLPAWCVLRLDHELLLGIEPRFSSPIYGLGFDEHDEFRFCLKEDWPAARAEALRRLYCPERPLDLAAGPAFVLACRLSAPQDADRLEAEMAGPGDGPVDEDGLDAFGDYHACRAAIALAGWRASERIETELAVHLPGLLLPWRAGLAFGRLNHLVRSGPVGLGRLPGALRRALDIGAQLPSPTSVAPTSNALEIIENLVLGHLRLYQDPYEDEIPHDPDPAGISGDLIFHGLAQLRRTLQAWDEQEGDPP